MADANTLRSGTHPEGCEVADTPMLNIGLACKKLAIAVAATVALHGAANAQSQTTTVASAETPASSSPSATLQATKGYGQIFNTKFGDLSAAEIQKHPQRGEILDGMKRSEKATFRDWEEQAAITEGDLVAERRQAAITEGDLVAERRQAAITEGKKIDEGTQEAIRDLIAKVAQIVPVYEKIISNGGKLSEDQKDALRYIQSLGKPEEWMTRIGRLLSA